MAALVGASVIVSAQNTNSSMTMENTNTSMKKKPRRHKPKPKTAEAGTAAGPTAEATPAPRKTGRCDPMQQEQTDLSGTYTGKVDYSDAGLTGDATLTITGNNFTLTAGSATQSGRVTAVTTCGYTAATMMFGDLAPVTPSPNPPPALPAVSLRVRKMRSEERRVGKECRYEGSRDHENKKKARRTLMTIYAGWCDNCDLR